MSSTLLQLNNEIALLVEKARQSLVEITNGHQGCASGIIWHGRGLILTNAHVVSHRQLKVILAGGRTLGARLLASDKDKDLAALVVTAEGLSAIDLGDSKALKPGQFVIALGHPWGVKGAATAGILIGNGTAHLGIPNAQDFLAVNLALRPGNSGGPLIDTEGRLVGINTIMTGPDTGLAIPVNIAKEFLRHTMVSWAG